MIISKHIEPQNRSISVVAIVATTFLLASPLRAADITSCNDVAELFKAPLTSNLFARQLALEQAVAVVEQADPPCNTVHSERARWAFADALDRYSRSQDFSNDAAQSWASKAATAYESYLHWFTTVNETDRRNMISVLLKLNTNASDFKAREHAWLRDRVGNTLVSLGAIYVRLKKQTTLLSTFSRVGQDNPRVFSQEAADEWFKWLQAQTDFERRKSKEEIRALIRDSMECASSWQAFEGFLQIFVTQNPSVANRWRAVLEDLKQWL